MARPTNINDNFFIESAIDSFGFSWYDRQSAKRVAIVELDQEESIDPLLNNGIPGGLYDPRLGPYNENEVCTHCKLRYGDCPGHFGLIDLSLPVFNPLLFDCLMNLLKSFCFHCLTFPPDSITDSLLAILERRVSKSTHFFQKKKLNSSIILEYENLPLPRIRKEFWRRSVKVLPNICTECKGKRILFSHNHFCKIMGHAVTKMRKNKNEAEDEILDMMDISQHEDDVIDAFGSSIDTRKTNKKSLSKKAMELSLKNKFKENQVIAAELIREKFRLLFPKECERLLIILPCLKDALAANLTHPTDIFFPDFILVPPPMYHPLGKSSTRDLLILHPAAKNYQLVIKHANIIRSLTRVNNSNATTLPMTNSSTPAGMRLADFNDEAMSQISNENLSNIISQKMEDLQRAVNNCYDETRAKDIRHQNTQAGFRQLLDKKEGLVRRHCMGKRVNHACRSVISPDPLIGVHEVGVPILFALRMTFPEPVTPYNIENLRELVRRGAHQYPGATAIESPNRIIWLKNFSEKDRQSQARMLRTVSSNNEIPIKVHRHLQSGDFLLMNRQPTLHRPSMQAHQVRILNTRTKTLRLHYAICKAYNADFDGDEMNGHFIQTLPAKAELAYLGAVPHQFQTPKNGAPLAGLIQDHVIAGTRLTMRDCFMDKETFFWMLSQGVSQVMLFNKPIFVPQPAILFPKRLWTGKQLISALLINLKPANAATINLELQGKSPRTQLWKESSTSQEEAVHLSDADLIIRSSELLKGIMDNTYIGAQAQSLPHCIGEAYGANAARDIFNALCRIFTYFLRDQGGFTLGLEDVALSEPLETKRATLIRNIDRISVPAFHRSFASGLSPSTGANVSTQQRYLELVNLYRDAHRAEKTSELQRCLGSYQDKVIQECNEAMDKINREIPQAMYKGFPKNNLHFLISTGAKGNITNLHQMALFLGQITIEGRPVSLSPSGRTLPSFRPYDLRPRATGMCTGRFLTGLSPQELFFHSMAGRDGLIDTAVKTSSSGYLQRCLIKHLEDLHVKFDGTVRNSAAEIIQFKYGDDGQDVIKSNFLASDSGLANIIRNRSIFEPLLKPIPKSLLEENESNWENDASVLVTNRFLSSNKVNFIDEPNAYKIKKRNVQKLIRSLQIRAQVEPGEMVGLVAAQSLGEPCTQMTMNTFHHAGRVEMNVTLGIPRIREILFKASANIQTPCMVVPIYNTPAAKSYVENKLLPRYNRTTLQDVMKGQIEETFNIMTQEHTIIFHFHSQKVYKRQTNLKFDQILKFMEKTFFLSLSKSINKCQKMKKSGIMRVKKETAIDAGGEGNEAQLDDEGMNLANDSNDEDDDNQGNKKKKSARVDENDGAEARKFKMDEDDDEASSLASEDVEELDVGERGEDGDDVGSDDDDNDVGDGNQRKVKVKKEAESDSMSDDGNDMEIDNERSQKVLDYNRCFTEYFSNRKERICVLKINFSAADYGELNLGSLLQKEVSRAVVHHTPGIHKAMLDKSSEPWKLNIEGLNFNVIMQEGQYLNLNRVYTNNISKMQERYGIECARQCVIKEMQTVFSHYGLSVSPRHLSLLSDHMTHNAEYRGCNRFYLNDYHSSFLSRVTFETATTFLRDAVVNGEKENLRSVSGNIFLGKLLGGYGSQAMDLLFNSDVQ